MTEGTRTGTQFGVYRLDALIGRGGMGEVYRAYDTVKDRTVAVKLLNPELAQDPTYQERFRRESHAAARLQEPHVVPIHDWGEIDGVLYIDMRLVVGADLRAVLRGGGAMNPSRAVSIVEQVGGALDAAHADGLIHRDIKPENILLDENDFAYLVDFGIAHSGDDSQLTVAGLAIGSYRYMAPERFDNDAVTPAADVYSLTCVLYECLTGSTPYQADTLTSAVKAHVMSAPPLPSRQNPGIPVGFDQVIAQGLAKSPEHRFGSAGLLSHAAREALTKSHPTKGYTVSEGPIGPGFGSGAGYAGVGTNQGFGAAFNPTMQSGPMSPGSGFQPSASAGYYSNPGFAGAGPGAGMQPASQSKAFIGLLLGLIVLALIGLAALLVWFVRSQDESGGDADVAVSTFTETQAPASQQAPQVAAPAGRGVPPAGSTLCPPIYGPLGVFTGSAIGSPVTSCAFAEEVRAGYVRGGSPGEARTVVATSPITGQTYTMNCVPTATATTCTGGENAVVHLY